MGRVTIGIWTDKNERLTNAVKACMKRTSVNRHRISSKACISVETFHKHMNDPEKITLRELRAYANELKMPVEDILDAIYLKEEK